MTIAKTLGVVLLVLAIAACEGAMGPMGPEGPQGPAGEEGLPGAEGSGTRVVFQGLLDENGNAYHALPEELSIDNPPILTCYVAKGDYYWAQVSTDETRGTWCGVEESNGGIRAFLETDQYAGWRYAIVIIY